MSILDDYFEIFAEGANDVNFRRQAQDVFRRIEAAIKKPESAHAKSGLTYNVGKLLADPSLNDLDLAFVEGGIRGHAGFFTVDPSPTIIIDGSPEHFANSKESFIHEFIHFLDHKRTGTSGKKSFSKDDPATNKEYFNDPFEYNAYFQQAMTSLEDYLSSLPPEKRSQAAQKAMGNSADEFWKKISSFNTGPFPKLIKHLTPDNLQKFKKRVAQAYTDINASLKSGDQWRKSGRMAALKAAGEKRKKETK